LISRYFDGLEALVEVVIGDIAVFILIKLSEYLEELHLAIEDLVFHLV